ncbi:MAG: flagellar hook-basal body protein [Armatimonadetes bacterium]|nr:flagellar hook-basal body protein [Armatimonadota bacterium]
MTRGMYAAASGMINGMERNEVLTNNLSNANTPGFKQDRLGYGSFMQVLLRGIPDDTGADARLMQGATLLPSEVDDMPGTLADTGNDLDLALEGNQWFVVQAPDGQRLTKNGHFARLADGTLVTSEGYPVLGEQGPLQLPSGAPVSVRENGEVASGGTVIGRLLTATVGDSRALTKEGENLFAGGNAVIVPAAGVRQGMLEQSNTDAMRTMVEMLSTMRGFEINQRVIQTQDQTLQQTIEVARH